jgi:putative ABC transport system permease protein
MLALFVTSLSCKMIQDSVDKSAESAKTDVRATVEIGYNEQEMMSSGTSEVALTTELVEKLKNNKYVKEVHEEIESTVNGDYKPVGGSNQSPMNGQIMGSGTENVNMDSLCGTVVSLANIEDSNFATGDNKLVKGVYPFDSNVKNAVIVSDEFVKQNDLKIGDKIQVLGISAKNKTDLEIVGVFKTYVKQSEMDDFFPAVAERNKYYTMPKTAIEVQISGNEKENAELKSIKTTLKNSGDIQAFIASVKNDKSINSKYLRFSSDLEKYKTLTSSIQKIADVARVLSIIVIILATGILGLLMILSLKNRKYEIGVLLSLGERKAAVILQMVLEMVLVAIVAFGIAFSVSGACASGLSKAMINQSNVESSTEKKMQQGILFADDVSKEKVDPIEEISIKPIGKDILIETGILNGFVVVISTLLPTIWILRKNPKKIMLREE